MSEKSLYHDAFIYCAESARLQRVGITDETLQQIEEADGLGNMECVRVKLLEGVESALPVTDLWLLEVPGPAWSGNQNQN